MRTRPFAALLAFGAVLTTGRAPAAAPIIPPASTLAHAVAPATQDEREAADGVPEAWRAASWQALWPGPPEHPASWRRVRDDLSQPGPEAEVGVARRRAAAAYALAYLDRSDRAAADASAALRAVFDADAPGGYDRGVVEVCGARALGDALFAVELDSATVDGWVRGLEAAGAAPDAEAESEAALARLDLARLLRAKLFAVRGEYALAIDALFEAARAGGPHAPAARGAAYELLRDTLAARTRRWLDAWAAREDATGVSPERASWPRMTELVELGEGRAAWWCWQRVELLDLDEDAAAARRAALAERLVVGHADERFMRDVARAAMAIARAATRDELLDLLARVGDASEEDDVRAWCLFARAHLSAEVEPRDAERAIALLERLVVDHPEHELARGARTRIFALTHLRVGRPLPAFDRPDAFGRTVDLAAREGRVLVLVFHEDSPRGRSLLSVLDQLGLLYDRERLDVVVVDVDADPEAARERYAASGRDWEVSWQGARNAAWPAAWDVKTFPSVFVVDAGGVIRARDVFGAQLTSRVLELLGGR